MPSITDKDPTGHRRWGWSWGSTSSRCRFVRERKDIKELREMLVAGKSEAKIVAKIENQQAVVNLNDLIDEADAIMVARGDLGIECPYEELPIIQRRTVKAMHSQGQAGHRRDAYARVDDREPDANARGSDGRGERGF